MPLYIWAGKIEGNRLDRYSRTGTSELKPDAGNVFADPRIVEFDKGKVSFAPDSPTSALGIEPIDVSSAGPRID